MMSGGSERLVDCFLPVLSFGDNRPNLPAPPGGPDAGADNGMVVGDQDARHRSSPVNHRARLERA